MQSISDLEWKRKIEMVIKFCDLHIHWIFLSEFIFSNKISAQLRLLSAILIAWRDSNLTQPVNLWPYHFQPLSASFIILPSKVIIVISLLSEEKKNDFTLVFMWFCFGKVNGAPAEIFNYFCVLLWVRQVFRVHLLFECINLGHKWRGMWRGDLCNWISRVWSHHIPSRASDNAFVPRFSDGMWNDPW